MKQSAVGTRLLGLRLCAALGVCVFLMGASITNHASAQEEAKSCEVPDYLLSSDNTLKRVAAAVKETRKLDILVIGTGSSALTGPGSQGTAYPTRLEFALRQKLDGINVNVTVEILPRRTAAENAETFPKLLADRKPTLVIWQTGTIDAMRAVDADEFTTALDDGIGAIQDAGADVVLMNMQYSPRTETVISATSYMDAMRVVAQQREVPLFDRFAIMRHWSETGEFDLYGAFHGLGLAKRVHDCIGRSLTIFVLNAAALSAGSPKAQH